MSPPMSKQGIDVQFEFTLQFHLTTLTCFDTLIRAHFTQSFMPSHFFVLSSNQLAPMYTRSLRGNFCSQFHCVEKRTGKLIWTASSMKNSKGQKQQFPEREIVYKSQWREKWKPKPKKKQNSGDSYLQWTRRGSPLLAPRPSVLVAMQVYSPAMFRETPCSANEWSDKMIPAVTLWCSSLPWWEMEEYK